MSDIEPAVVSREDALLTPVSKHSVDKPPLPPPKKAKASSASAPTSARSTAPPPPLAEQGAATNAPPSAAVDEVLTELDDFLTRLEELHNTDGSVCGTVGTEDDAELVAAFKS